MRRLLTILLAAMAFVACTQNDVEELTANRVDAPETLTVGFEGGDTRIELNEALKTVWTKGDLASVFYKSDANQKWQYQGETGERLGTLRRVDTSVATMQTDYVVVAYPYNTNYILNRTNGNIEASLPAVQSYKEGSYGSEGNIMVAQSEFTQFSLKSVVGWLRVELTGEGESVKSITLRGNAGEQVVGLIYVDTFTAEATLASEMGEASDEEQVGGVGGGLEFDNTVFTELTLDCGNGVELGAEATAFYIALLPQTFEEGITVEVECGNGTSTTKSTADKLVVERNHIVPMASFKYDGVLPDVYELAYTTNNGGALDPYTTEGFGGEFMENIYDAATGRGVLKFAGAVSTIPEQAFGLCENLTWIDIPEGITTIGASAFTDCTALEEITIPASVTNVGNEAFKNCPCKATINCDNVSFEGAGFTEVIIGDGVTAIGDYAFHDCGSLTSVTIGNSVTTIGDSAFYNCDSLTSVTIPDSVTTIGNSAFYYCSSLTSITIPDSVTTIGWYAFENCDSLTSVTIGDSVTTIGDQAFFGCHSLTSVTIPDSVTRIGDSAFWGCSSLTSVTIGDSVTTIGDSAFYYCTSLTSVYCEATTPPSLGYSAFKYDDNGYVNIGCPIYVPEGSLREYKMAENWSDYADCFVEYDFETGEEVAISNKLCYTATALVTPNKTSAFNVTIVSNEWDEATGKGVITFDGELTTIGDKAFYSRTSLRSVTIPDSVTTIGDSAFNGCDRLTSVTIPDSVTSIGASAFNDCYSLTSVTIGNSVTTIGNSAFYDCISLTSVTIGDSVTTIGDSAFYNCNSLTSVTIPDSVTTIGNSAFSSCSSLISVTIGDSVTTIGNSAFNSCESLTSVYITDVAAWCNISFGDSFSNPLYYAKALYLNNELVTELTIPDSVTTIAYCAFYNCSSLTSVTIGDSVTTIGDEVFYDCDGLTSVTIGNSVTTIGDSAFRGCASLTSVTIGDSVTTIGDYAFYGCSSLTSVTIPDSVTKIGERAFYNCTSLTSVYCKATTPPSLVGTYAFKREGVGYHYNIGCPIYVPAESVKAYKAVSGWSEYTNYIVGYDFETGEVVE